ncbi:MAG: DUF4235 domain-containing protein [Bifidobacteriaceae bacterium]|jgi:DMSO/TMAO reductase YedYZ heme-binding membrane subunit|nr:DUF4235 domain-containing protein [Bifidobacteriaceae bacterium]
MKLTTWLYTTLASVAAGFVASAVVKLIWKAASGKSAPADPEDLTVSTTQVTLFAVALAAATAAAQTLASRKALTALRRREAKDIAALEQ